MHSDQNESSPQDVSRRRFLKGALLGGAALTMSSKLALAEQMATGRLTARDIHGAGMRAGVVRMASNENPVGPSPRALRAIANNMFDVNRYSIYTNYPNDRFSGLGDPEDRTPLIEELAGYDGVKLPKKERRSSLSGSSSSSGSSFSFGRDDSPPPTPYLVSCGSGPFLKLLPLAYLSQGGGEVIEAETGYGSISRAAEGYNDKEIPTSVFRVPLTADYRHDLDAMRNAITSKTSMVVITNPNNPTGTLLSYEELEQFVNAVPKHVIVVIDEAYIHFVRDPNYKRAIPLAIANDNVIVLRTFSKVYGLPAMRLGYSVSSTAIQEKILFYMADSIPGVLTQIAGMEAVKDLAHVRRSQQAVWDFRDQCYPVFDRMGLEYIKGEGNFFQVKVGSNRTEIYRELGKRRVQVSTRGGDRMAEWLRVSAGTARETEVFLNELEDILSKSI